MRFFIRFFLPILFLFLALSSKLTVPVIHAAGEFETTYKVQYDVDETGKTQVTEQIVLKNKTSNFYADKFELKIGSTKVDNVKAQDNAGPLQNTVNFDNNVTTINVVFNQKVIGVDKTLPWTLTYTSNELAAKSGQIWEVSIPRLANSADIVDYQASVSIPSSFGPIAFAVPTPQTNDKVGAKQVFTFNKDQLVQSGISLSFGEKQVFTFTLNYHLQNNNLTTQTEDVALPPDNDYQKIVLEKLDPAPMDVIVDKDNNFIAKYKLASHQKLDVTAQGHVEVFSKPFRKIYPNLSQSDRDLYTSSQKFWEINSSLVSKKAQELKTPKAIYDFVSSYLSYNEDRLRQGKGDRRGAAAAAADPKNSICTDFTDLFIAIARKAGIPAREVEGYAFTQNDRLRPLSLALYSGDVLHAWPEYWDDNLGWVQVDPTWGSTSGGLDYFNKLDFNHITFVQRGMSSETPFPAGSYKNSSSQKRDVLVEFADVLPNPTIDPQVSLSVPSNIISGIPVRVTANIANTGNTSVINKSVVLTSHTLRRILSVIRPQPGDNNAIQIDILPPFAKRSYSFDFISPNLFKSTQDTLLLSYAEAQIAVPISASPIYSLVFLKSFIISAVLAALIITAGLFLYKKHHKRRRNRHHI